MDGDIRRVADYFVVAGLPTKNPKLLDEYNLEANLKPSAYQDPITDITVIFPGQGENVPDYYQLIDATPTGLSANLNHGSFRAPEVYLCFRRGRSRPPLVEIGVLYNDKEKVMPDSQVVEFTVSGLNANVNNTNNSATYLTYRRANETSPCNELVVMDVCVIVASKGEVPPHSFMKISKTLNKGMVGADVYICYKKSMNRADLVSYKPELLSMFPSPKEEENGEEITSHSSTFKLDDNVALFCLPMGATLECWPATSSYSATVRSTFVLSPSNNEKIYGSSITFYEEYPEEGLTDEQKLGLNLVKYRKKTERKILSNKCICVLSHWPFFEAFEKFLFFLYKRQLMGPPHIPLERYISHFLYEIPFPSPERPRILFQLSMHPEDRIALFQPEELPLPRSGASFINLLMNLGPDNCLSILLLALTEQKILIHSLRQDVLTSIAEAVKQMIFPFYWQCPYIPLCPIGMSDYLAAPLPFIIGLDSRFFDLYDQPSDVNAVDLDTNTVTLCQEKSSLSVKLLPKKPSRYLRSRLVGLLEKCLDQENLARKYAAQEDDGAIDFDFKMKRKEMQLEMEIREAFLHFMVSILAYYRSYLLPITKPPTVGATDVINLFDQEGFIHSRDKNYREFYNMLLKTQMFTKFIEERSFVSDVNTSLAFFDECQDKAFTNGGSVRGDPTTCNVRFLELEEGFDSGRTVFLLPPDASDLPPNDVYEYEKFEKLNPDLFGRKPDHNEIDNNVHKSSKASVTITTPVSALARRTKQEIRSAQKIAKKSVIDSPYLWAKCLINTSYSLWFIHLPSYMLNNNVNPSNLRIGHSLLQRIHRLKLYPADEICYRVMMQLCGMYNQPLLAVKILMDMQSNSLHPNAVTYGYYNKAVLESQWPVNTTSLGQLQWNKLKNLVAAIRTFKNVGKDGFLRHERTKPSTNPQVTPSVNKENADNVSRTSTGSGESGMSQDSKKIDENSKAINGEIQSTDIGYASMNENAETKSNNDDENKENIEAELGVKELEFSSSSTSSSKNPLQNNEVEAVSMKKRGANRALFQRTESEELEQQVIDYMEGSRSTTPSDRNSKSRSQSVDLLEPVPEDNNKQFLSPPPPPSKTLSSSSNNLAGMSPMIGTPVTSNDPLGAFVEPTTTTASLSTPPNTMVKSASSYNELSKGDILGEPFSSERISNYNSNSSKIGRSTTIPRSLSEQVGGESSSNNISSPFSFKNLSRLKKGSSYLLSSLSPNPKTTETWNKRLNSVQTAAASAVTTLSKRVEEIRESKYLDTPGGKFDDIGGDTVSQDSTGSTASRRHSETPTNMSYDPTPDMWSSLTGAIWDQFWSYDYGITSAGATPASSKGQRVENITERLENFYSKLPKIPPNPVAIKIEMTSASNCRSCNSVLYDEEIMAGWSAEDSNLNTACPFCDKLFVPFLSIQVVDNRPNSMTSLMTPAVSLDSLHLAASSHHSNRLRKPFTTDNISVNYLSPLVLRKELEHMLQQEGDECLNDPKFVDKHPIVYWNLLWYFERISVKSHISGLVLEAPSLNPSHLIQHKSWTDLSHKNVFVECYWDNTKLHHKKESFLYMQWRNRKRNASQLVSALITDDLLNNRSLMEKIIKGVQRNDLFHPIRSLLDDRLNFKDSLKSGETEYTCIYRDILYLTLVSLGQDNIDISAFDREYRKAFDKLKKQYANKYDKVIHKSDLIPNTQTLICRKFFRELKL